MFDEADEVELIDLPPDDLLARLRAGKVYVRDEAPARSSASFASPISWRCAKSRCAAVADRVEAAARASAATGQVLHPRLPGDRMLVATGPDAQSEQLIRAGKRLADALDAEWTVVYVETPALLKLSEAQRNRRIDLMRLAESLGAEAVTLDGPTAAEALLEYAATRDATRIIVGAPKRRGLARAGACLDGDGARAAGARLRCDHDRAHRARRFRGLRRNRAPRSRNCRCLFIGSAMPGRC